VNLDQAGAFGFGRFSGGGDLGGAQAADADRFVQRRVEADGGNADACDLQGLQEVFALLDLEAAVVDEDRDHFRGITLR
jgi:hypothetical protein